jgi:PAS domain S-box-containing protein
MQGIAQMKDERKTKKQLIQELAELRQRAARLEAQARERPAELEQEISERKLAEEELQRTSRRLQLALHALDVGIWDINAQTGAMFMSPSWRDRLGIDATETTDMQNKAWMELLHPDDRDRVTAEWDAFFNGDIPRYDIEYRIFHTDGLFHWVHSRGEIYRDQEGNPTRLLGGYLDITERKHMEAQLQEYTEHLEQLVREKVNELELERAKMIHTSKLAALGQMATGVAHELNQPLTAMLLDAEYLAERLGSSTSNSPTPLQMDELHTLGENIIRGIDRCTRIINHLRTFARVSNLEPSEISLNKAIEDSLILISQRLREHGVDVQLRLDPDLPNIVADPHRMEQVFVNLISNAEYGITEMARRVEAGKVQQSDHQGRLEISTFVQGDRVTALVRDNGIGIPEADQAHIFEPFFTTKPVGEGTGLGLSISYGIVTDFGGEIAFKSTENEETVFTIEFPIRQDSSHKIEG